jgi:iodotyrosine deiodinase
MTEFPFVKYEALRFPPDVMLNRSLAFFKEMTIRRSVRFFSDQTIDEQVLINIISTACTAPSGANKQPWTFCLVTNKELKKRIRAAAEKEEAENYASRMSAEWLRDLAPLGTDEKKEFLETAPALIVVFRRPYEISTEGTKHQNYYVQESVGIACGMLITAIHHAGLCCLTHTPSPMNFLEQLLERPSNEKAYLLLPVGYASEDAVVPDIKRKPLEMCVKTYF